MKQLYVTYQVNYTQLVNVPSWFTARDIVNTLDVPEGQNGSFADDGLRIVQVETPEGKKVSLVELAQ